MWRDTDELIWYYVWFIVFLKHTNISQSYSCSHLIFYPYFKSRLHVLHFLIKNVVTVNDEWTGGSMLELIVKAKQICFFIHFSPMSQARIHFLTFFTEGKTRFTLSSTKPHPLLLLPHQHIPVNFPRQPC